MADRYGSLLRRLLCSAERLSERATRRGSLRENTPFSRSSALLVSVMCCDQRLVWDLGVARPLLACTGMIASAFPAPRTSACCLACCCRALRRTLGLHRLAGCRGARGGATAARCGPRLLPKCCLRSGTAAFAFQRTGDGPRTSTRSSGLPFGALLVSTLGATASLLGHGTFLRRRQTHAG